MEQQSAQKDRQLSACSEEILLGQKELRRTKKEMKALEQRMESQLTVVHSVMELQIQKDKDDEIIYTQK